MTVPAYKGTATAAQEIAWSLSRFQMWGTLGWADIKFRYRRTIIGPFWLTLSTGAMVLAVGIVYAGLFKREIGNYIPYFAVGLIVWNLFSGTFVEGCGVFTVSAGTIKSSTTPLPVYILRMTWRNVITFLHNLVVIAVLWLYFRWSLSPAILLSVAGFAVLMVFIVGLVFIFSVLCTRFRDIPQIIGAVLQLVFFLTPIIWVPADLGRASWVITWNPMYSLIEVIRAPLLGNVATTGEWGMAIACAVIAAALGFGLYGRYRHRISYWL